MKERKTRLSVNINKIATLRNARGGKFPDLIRAAKDIQAFGAEGITVHPRPDERHIRRKDVYDLKNHIHTEFNIEGYPSKDFISLIHEIRPAQVTLVPDPPDVLTSNAGWDVKKHKSFLQDVITELKESGARVSLFMEPDTDMIDHCVATGTDRIELYTETYSSQYSSDPDKAIKPFIAAAIRAGECELGLNAGHDLNLENLRFFSQNIPGLLEVSIGHAIICDALYFGLENTIQMYRRELM
ncbi:MAG: pyridoxine 5'-phosphate synthase [Bacteroidetes bacterium]|nr:MAG: pyridoxine 5'-phosphate synthase [Bacteroidota bacterium]REK04854.1 MAG: pyridoxine 5'-phosphate synthase [Bacteroidota bacterium]REK36326.1 MAG: pyridoxine 5'-phosphate synthase [Bacteroidota bacterium]REK51008.1 MAG: pyridoxine 5'-phosphate synthase [Bacteroidota bacterium]